MKGIMSIVLFCIVGIALMGCSATPMSPYAVDLQESANLAQGECYNRLQAQDAIIASQMAKVPEDQIALVVVLQSMQENNKALMALATGNNYNPCATGSNAFDVQIAEVRSKNLAASSISNGVFGLGKWFVGGWTAMSIADKISGDVITATGGSEVNQNSKNTIVESGGAATTTTSHSSEPSVNDESSSSESGSGDCPTGMTLRYSTGECITYEEEAAIEAEAAGE